MKDSAAVRKSTIGRRDLFKLGAGALLASAAMGRKASAQGNVGPPVSIDMHTHWAPEAYTKALSKMRRPGSGTPNPLDFDLDKRRQWMDTHGVQMHVLTLSGGMPWQWVPPDAGAYLAQIINDANVEAHTAFPERFVGGIEVSIRDPQLAMKELNRMAGKPGMRTVHLPNSIEGHDYLFEERYAAFLARCEQLGYPERPQAGVPVAVVRDVELEGRRPAAHERVRRVEAGPKGTNMRQGRVQIPRQ